MLKNSPANAGDTGSIPGSGSSPGGGNGTPLQSSCLENSMDRGARRAAVPAVTRRVNTPEHTCTPMQRSRLSTHARLCSSHAPHLLRGCGRVTSVDRGAWRAAVPAGTRRVNMPEHTCTPVQRSRLSTRAHALTSSGAVAGSPPFRPGV